MKLLILAALAFTATAVDARTWQSDYPSCDATQQRRLKSGSGRSAMRDRITMRANSLQADIGTAVKARPISRAQGQRMWARVDAIRRTSDRVSGRRGFLTAAERASYDRQLDAVAEQLCR